ncbi:MAG: iron ABC transporter [Spirochaetaceae bacterium]|nr:MAG: iron ABC transporter [Spirochaetaceae bacterium]
MFWTTLDSWIVLAAALAGASCALTGSFLVLRKMSMMGDAISHAVLPGIAIAFILTASRGSGVMFVGAALVGVLTAVLVEVIRKYGNLEQGASMGVVFTVLFAIGLILIEQAARHVDIHPDHVLFGAVEMVPLYTVSVAGLAIPRGVLVLAVVFLINLTVVTVLFKELRLATFDPALATTLGINARAIHYLLMTLVAVTTVAAFEVVGSILVIAMLIVPGATAHLLTRRLLPFLVVSVLTAVLAAGVGHLAAIGIPPHFGYEDVVSAGSIATVLGLCFFTAFILAPEQGILARAWNRVRLQLAIAMQDVLGLLARSEERSRPAAGNLSRSDLRGLDRSPFALRGRTLHLALLLLAARGMVLRENGRYRLTERGNEAAQGLLRTHRLWERFFFDDGQVELGDLHPAADYLEHYTDDRLQADLAGRFAREKTDPRGNRIPGL